MSLLPIRRIFLPLACHGAETQSAEAAAAEAAGILAHRFGATVTAFLPLIDPKLSIAYVGEGASGAVIESLIEAGKTENSARHTYARNLITQHLAAVPCHMEEQEGREGDVIAQHVRAHDLSVLSRGPADRWSDTGFLALVEALVMEGGRPLLLTPASVTPMLHETSASALLAWTDTAEAAHALSASLAFLGPNTQVKVVGIGGADTRGAVQLLTAHGIPATGAPLDCPEGGLLDDPTGDAILKAAQDHRADLIIMGAFVHSRLRQMIMGGPTRTLIKESAIPLLLAH